jgi:hypothetical protein
MTKTGSRAIQWGKEALLPACIAAAFSLAAPVVHAQMPVTTCDAAGIGSVTMKADVPGVTIDEVSTGTTSNDPSGVPYCLVKVTVPQAIHIWVGLPTGGKRNGSWQSLGGGVYSGTANLTVPTGALVDGYAGATDRLGHGGPRFRRS